MHELTVVHSTAGLQQLLARCTASAVSAVLQPFIAHGNCMFKVRGSKRQEQRPRVVYSTQSTFAAVLL